MQGFIEVIKEDRIISIQKEQLIKLLYKCAKEFDKDLANKRLMIISETKDKKLESEEVFFPISTFYHLTGVIAINRERKEYNAIRFYKDLINGAIDAKKIYIKDNTTNLKLEILQQLIYLDKHAKMIGDYSSTKIYLRTQKLLGGVNSCMGFIKNNNYKYYIPNTILKEDIRNITNNRKKVIAIFKRSIHEKKYKNITYIKKDYKLKDILKEPEIYKNIDTENIFKN